MRQVTITLPLSLHAGELPHLRAALVDLVGREQTLFHQHLNDPTIPDPYHRAYPLIQYALRRGRPTVMGFAAGAEALLQHLLPKLPSSLVLGGQEHPLGNCDVKIQEVELRLDDSPHSFGVCGWLALNTKNYASWKHHTDDQLRLNLLDQALTGHLRSMAERLGMPDFKQITGRVQRVDNQKRIRWHGAELVRFDVLAETNLHFPWGIGLGRVAAFGFGESLAVNDYVARRLYILNRAGVGAVVE